MKQLAFPRRIPFVEDLGLELWAFEGGRAEVQLDVAERHFNHVHTTHGGVLMTLLDVAMAHAARSVLSDSDRASGPGVVTIEMKTAFMRPAEGRLRAQGTLLQRTKSMAFTEGRVLNAAGELCAHATGTFKYRRATPAPGSDPAP